jgi:hypothetical protein
MQGQANLSVANLIEKLEPELDKIKYLRALILDPITSAVALNRNSAATSRATNTRQITSYLH